MPKELHRNKRGGSRIARKSGSNSRTGADSVKDLLARGHPTLSRAADQAGRQSFWRNWLTENLPAELLAHLSGIVEREATLVLFTESSAWSARLRYVVRELEPRIRQARPAIQQISVRVLPRRPSG
jgi:hypothetical protein